MDWRVSLLAGVTGSRTGNSLQGLVTHTIPVPYRTVPYRTAPPRPNHTHYPSLLSNPTLLKALPHSEFHCEEVGKSYHTCTVPPHYALVIPTIRPSYPIQPSSKCTAALGNPFWYATASVAHSVMCTMR